MKKKTDGTYRDIYYESPEELGMLKWLFELKDAGYIRRIERGSTYVLAEKIVHKHTVKLKTKNKILEQTLMREHVYTPEFNVTWNWTKARDKFLWYINDSTKFDKLFVSQFDDKGECFTIIEVKPDFDQNNMTRLFMLNQKWMWDKYKIFVNLVKISDLFPKSFTPKEYLKTPTGKDKKLRWKPRNLINFVK